ncbi:hypothetical protein [Oleomonas cavernae]|uniref:hypothetical protein n=1 Tax=Oleomonas cavernae TaxID=2320859 RepID=UPI0011C3CC4D|nr:hypothetical protein [Oleomonas cavernae]
MALSTAPALIRTTAALALALLAGCGGREELAPVEYLGGGGGAVSSGGGVTSDGEGPAVEAAPLAPVDRGGITATPLSEPGAAPAPALAAPRPSPRHRARRQRPGKPWSPPARP